MRRALILLAACAALSLPGLGQRVIGGGGTATSFVLLSGTGGTCTDSQVGFYGGTFYGCVSGSWSAFAAGSSVAWPDITGGTNTTASMVVGSGASLASTGTGTIAATSVPAAGLGAGTLGNDIAGNAATATAPQAGHSTGTGNFVLATSPTLVTPALGTPSALVLTNATGEPASIDLTNASNLPFSALPALPWVCNGPGLGDGTNAIAAATYHQTNCYNGTGHTVTISGIKCYADAGSSTMDVKDSSGNDLLTGAITCSTSFAAGTQSSTVTLANGAWLAFTFVADGTTKQTSWVIVGTY